MRADRVEVVQASAARHRRPATADGRDQVLVGQLEQAAGRRREPPQHGAIRGAGGRSARAAQARSAGVAVLTRPPAQCRPAGSRAPRRRPRAAHALAALEVGDRPGQPQHAIVPAAAEARARADPRAAGRAAAGRAGHERRVSRPPISALQSAPRPASRWRCALAGRDAPGRAPPPRPRRVSPASPRARAAAPARAGRRGRCGRAAARSAGAGSARRASRAGALAPRARAHGQALQAPTSMTARREARARAGRA